MKTLARFMILSMTLGLFVSSDALAVGPPWSLFGTAAAVRTGAQPNAWAVRLTSTGFVTFGGIAYQHPQGGLKFNDLYYFGTDFRVVQFPGFGCGGGSPRFQLGIDTDGNGTFDDNIFVYIGPSPTFTLCDTIPLGNWQTTGNLVGNNDACRYDTSQIVAGTQCNTYAGAQAIMSGFPNHEILGMQLVVDSGWFQPGGTEVIDVDKVIINQHIVIARGYAK